MKKVTTLVSAILVALFVTSGCGGNLPTNTQTNQFAGRHYGDIVFEAGGRGGGPSLQLAPFVVNDNGVVSGSATFADEHGQHQGLLNGTLTPTGELSLSVAMDGIQFTAAGDGLKWTQTRGGPARYVDGTITVTQKYDESPYGQAWANSRIMFWNENE